jgi:hypothetical protein
MQTHSKSEVAIAALLRAKECFQADDWISSTILAGAAQQVLRDLCEARGLPTTIGKVSASLGHQEIDVHNLIVCSYNGMKHADRDPDKDVSVSSAEPQALIVMAAADLARLNPPHSPEVDQIFKFARTFNVE